MEFAVSLADIHSSDTKVHQVRLAIGNVAAAGLQNLQPAAIGKWTRQSRVGSSHTHATIVDAWKVGLAGDSGTETQIQSVVPDVEFPNVRSIYSRNEINSVGKCDVNNVFIGADSVESWYLVVGQVTGLDSKTEPGMSEARNCSLLFGPTQNRQVPRRPICKTLSPRIILV